MGEDEEMEGGEPERFDVEGVIVQRRVLWGPATVARSGSVIPLPSPWPSNNMLVPKVCLRLSGCLVGASGILLELLTR